MTSDQVPAGLTREEWEMVLRHRLVVTSRLHYNRGLEAAARKAESYARECGGGGDGYLNLANAIREMITHG